MALRVLRLRRRRTIMRISCWLIGKAEQVRSNGLTCGTMMQAALFVRKLILQLHQQTLEKERAKEEKGKEEEKMKKRAKKEEVEEKVLAEEEAETQQGEVSKAAERVDQEADR